MGYAKYHEDDLEIYDERMFNMYNSMLPSVEVSYSRTIPVIEYKAFVPSVRKDL